MLPKGQQKYLETTYFIPVETEKNASSVFLQHKLKTVSGGGIVDEASQIAQLLPNYQYLLAVLSSESECLWLPEADGSDQAVL